MNLFTRLFALSVLSVSLASAASFQKGASIAHWMAKVYAPAVYGGDWFDEEDVAWLAHQGFDHIRVAVDTRELFPSPGHLDEAKLAPFLRALAAAQKHRLGVLFDAHFLSGGKYDHGNQDPVIYTDPKAMAEAALAWEILATRFKDVGEELRFELINEPFAPTEESLNVLQEALIAAVRKVDTQRFLYITTNNSSSFKTLHALRVPADLRVGIILHYDEPYIFTHQRASWKACPPDMTAVEFPGTVPDFTKDFPADHFAAKASGQVLTTEAVDEDFRKIQTWLDQHAKGHAVLLGAFGIYELAPRESQTRYVRAVRQAAEKVGWGWTVWSYNGGFAVRSDQGEPTAVLPGLFQP